MWGKKEKHIVPLRENDERSERLKKPHSNVTAHQASLQFDVKEGEDAEEYVLMDHRKESAQKDKEKKMAERVRNLKETHEKLKDQYLNVSRNDEIDELENVPAYIRKKIIIDQQLHSEDQEVSRYRLTDEEDGEESGPKLRNDNSYLHDNVD
ncbi:MAG TPA: hypothetical protein ENO20_10045 [Bacteroides sp.]|nr:hypothetical protein [Bacteroides sp.]